MVDLVGRARFLASGQDDPHSVTITELCDEVERLQRKLVDRRYMLEAYEQMLGPNGLKVAQMWRDKRVHRVHYSWGPGATSMTGEERAAAILEWEEAARRAVPVENIDA